MAIPLAVLVFLGNYAPFKSYEMLLAGFEGWLLSCIPRKVYKLLLEAY